MKTNHHHQNGEDDGRAARLTAYALGQLDAQEQAAVEQELAGSDEGRRTVEAARNFADRLADAVRQEPLSEPSFALREAVHRRLDELEIARYATASDSGAGRRRRLRRLFVFLAVSLLVAAVPLGMFVNRIVREPGDNTAHFVPMSSAEQQPATPTIGNGEGSAAEQQLHPRHGPKGTQPRTLDSSAGAAIVQTGRIGAYSLTAIFTSNSSLAELTPGKVSGFVVSLPAMVAKANTNADAHDGQPTDGITIHSGEIQITTDGIKGQVPHGELVGGAWTFGLEAGVADVVTGGSLQFDGIGWRQGATAMYDTTTHVAQITPPGTASDVNGNFRGGTVVDARSAQRNPLDVNGFGGLVKSGAGMMILSGADLLRGQGYGSAELPCPPSNSPVTVTGGSLTMNTTGVLSVGLTGAQSSAPMVWNGKNGSEWREPPPSCYTVVKPQWETKGEAGFGAVQMDHGRMPPDSADVERSTAPGTEQYDPILENPFQPVAKQPLSTFSIDVDTASYANVRRFLQEGRLPPRDAVRIEEMINYFPYHYAPPQEDVPFAVHMETAPCPWNGRHRLLRVGLKGREIDRDKRGPSNLVFLLDVSGSMADPDKLTLVKQAMKMLVEQLGENDRVAIVTYANDTGVRLESTNATQKQAITDCIDALRADGGTNGGAGMRLSYEQARKNFLKEGNNRVIWATDGDLNVGITSDDDLVRLIQQEAKSGVFLTILGVGTGNLKDSKMEKIADRGNGSYHYLDSLREARKVLVEQLSGSTVTIAKDVKIQVEFNPSEVAAYRLIGYENRQMAAKDFANDKKDAGDIGAGHAVTALYELVPAREETPIETTAETTALKYQRVPEKNLTEAAQSGELLTLRLRYKEPQGEKSRLLEFAVKDSDKRFGQASPDFQFAAAVASFGMLLRGSQHAGNATLASVEEIAAATIGDDPGAYRAEFLDLVRKARQVR